MYKFENFNLGPLRTTLRPAKGPKSPKENKIRVYIDIVGRI
jgi:hypothetical protein